MLVFPVLAIVAASLYQRLPGAQPLPVQAVTAASLQVTVHLYLPFWIVLGEYERFGWG